MLAVLNELKHHDADLQITFVTDRSFGRQAGEILKRGGLPIRIKTIVAGKLRRYHTRSFLAHLFDVTTNARNLIDLPKVLAGFTQSLWLLMRERPDVVFTKGGFVCLPLGLAAAALRIPLVIHDSDAHPGLTNRVLARWASVIATGAPLENYSYPASRSHYVGIPVDARFRPISIATQQRCKDRLGLHDTKKPLVAVSGGGLGARSINMAVATIAAQLLPKTAIYHVTGETTHAETLQAAPEHIDYIIEPFVPGLAILFGGADVVVARAGATTLAELAAMAKPVIIIPNPLLTGGHQLKNAAVYQKAGAAIVLDESKLVCNPLILKRAIELLLRDPKKCQAMSRAIHRFARPDAATDMAALIVEAAAAHMRRAG